MATAGFYCRPFVGADDNVCCFMCNKNLDGWEPSDDSWSEHVKHAANCPLVRLDLEANRKATFSVNENWRHKILTPDRMAAAGFYYWPKSASSKDSLDDTSTCFQCGLSLDGWDDTDDPMQEHAKRRPECPFVTNRVAIKPCSFEFLLAMMPDQAAVRHISCSTNNAVKDDGKKFQLPQKKPTVVRKTILTPSVDTKENVDVQNIKEPPTKTARPSKRSTLIASTPEIDDPPTKKQESRRTTTTTSSSNVIPPPILPEKEIILVNPLSGLEDLLSAIHLQENVGDVVNILIARKLQEFDKKSSEIMKKFDVESAKMLLSINNK